VYIGLLKSFLHNENEIAGELNMARISSKTTILSAAIIAALASTNASAQYLEEVIVTAQKREEGLQETAISITAITDTLMDDLNISTGNDYEAVVPALSYRQSPARLSLRGIGRITGSLGSEPGIAVYTDQVYSPETTVLTRSTSLTTERVEVLRGPQGTLFGRNAAGGAINVTTKRPTEDFQHHVRGTVGNNGRQNWGVSSAGPITDDLGYRVYGYQISRDAYTKNVGGPDIWDQETTGFGAQLSWNATDNLNIWLNYTRDEVDFIGTGIDYGGYVITPYRPDLKSTAGLFISPSYQTEKENPAVKDPYKVDHDDPLNNEDEDNNKWTTHITWDLEALTIRYIGAYSENTYIQGSGDLDFISNPDNRIVESAESSKETTSHEIQFLSAHDGPLQWIAGLYYYDNEGSQPYSILAPVTGDLDNAIPGETYDASVAVPNPERLLYHQNAELESTSQAVYADVNYTFNDQWKLTVGARYTEDEKDGYEDRLIIVDPEVYGVGFAFPQDDCCGWIFSHPSIDNRVSKDDWDNVSGRVVLDYAPAEDHMTYLSIASGYKAGGFRLGSLQPNPSFDEESLLSYEIGYKGVFNDALQLNASAYFYDYEDMQVLTTRLDDDTGLPLTEVINAEEAEVKGMEIEAIWLATDSLTILANYSYIDGEYTDFCCFVDTIADPDGEQGEQDLSGNPLTQAPENKVYVNAAYTWRTASAGEFMLSGAYTWVDERQYDIWNTDETLADDYYRMDAMASWISPSENLRVILSGKNLTEEFTWNSLTRVNADGANSGLPIEPRMYSLEVQFDF